MNSITELLTKRHSDGRKRLLVKATFLAKRQGWSKTKVQEKLIKKITTIKKIGDVPQIFGY